MPEHQNLKKNNENISKWIDKIILDRKKHYGRKNASVRLRYSMLKSKTIITLTWYYQYSASTNILCSFLYEDT